MMSPSDPIAEVEDLSVTLGGRPILSGVGLSISPGEVLVLLGPNGAGKSTLVRALTGRLPRTGGRVQIAGADPVKSAKARAAVGFVPQQITLYERLTPRENLSVFAALMGVTARQIAPRIARYLELVGLSDRIDDPVGSLSGGMRRRVNIAVALMHEPSLLILDEPSAGLDFRSRGLIADILTKLRATGIATLLITHDSEEAALLADTIAVMVAGHIRAIGTRAGLLNQVFGNRREMRVVRPMTHFSGQQAYEALSAAGLAPDEDSGVWSGFVEMPSRGVENLLSALSAGSILAEEVSIRDASLNTLVSTYVKQVAAQ